MQAYNRNFAEVYNSEYSGFATRVSPIIERFYVHTNVGNNRKILDLCCGTGQLANYFAKKGYYVTGIDASEHMLKYALDNNKIYVKDRHIRFLQGDITEFDLPDNFGLVVSTYDSINHLENHEMLSRCFALVFQALIPEGYLVFDLNTRKSLLNWNFTQIKENDRLFMMSQGIYTGYAQQASIRISGFVHTANDLYKKFEQIILNSVFNLDDVRHLLLTIGFSKVYFAETESLEIPIEDPESIGVENGVCIIAQK